MLDIGEKVSDYLDTVLGGFWRVGNLVVILCLHLLDYMKSRYPILFEV